MGAGKVVWMGGTPTALEGWPNSGGASSLSAPRRQCREPPLASDCVRTSSDGASLARFDGRFCPGSGRGSHGVRLAGKSGEI